MENPQAMELVLAEEHIAAIRLAKAEEHIIAQVEEILIFLPFSEKIFFLNLPVVAEVFKVVFQVVRVVPEGAKISTIPCV